MESGKRECGLLVLMVVCVSLALGDRYHDGDKVWER